MNNNRKKRILYITPLPPPYHGPNVDSHNLVSNWDSSTYSLITFDISDKKKKADKIGRFTLRNILVTLKHSFRLIYHFVFKNRKYDIVLVYIDQNRWAILRDSIFILIVRFTTRAKIVCRYSAGGFSDFYNNSGIFKLYIKKILLRLDMIITEGHIISKQFKSIVSSVEVVSAHIGTPFTNEKSFYKKNSYFQVLYIIGQHRKEKGFWDLLYSIPEVISRNPNVRFNFVGDINEGLISKKNVQRFIKQHNIEEFIDFQGVKYGDEKDLCYQSSSIMTLPSYTEGLPLSILEGMSFGLPIVATRVGVIPEIIKEEVNGYLLNPGDRKKLIELISFLSMNHDLVEKIGNNNREYVLKSFTMQDFCRRLEACFDLIELEN
jgi:glycosyltransferase involved in cell wall biosynthesis